MQKNRLFIVLACLNCAHTAYAVEKSNPGSEENAKALAWQSIKDNAEKDERIPTHLLDGLDEFMDGSVDRDPRRFQEELLKEMNEEMDRVLPRLPLDLQEALLRNVTQYKDENMRTLGDKLNVLIAQKREEEALWDQVDTMLRDRKGNLSKDQWDKLDDIKESIDSGLKNMDRVYRLWYVVDRLATKARNGDFPGNPIRDNYDKGMHDYFRRHSDELFMKGMKIADQSLMQAPVPDHIPLTQYAGIMLNMEQDRKGLPGWWSLYAAEEGLRTQKKEFGPLIETLNNEQNLTKRDALIETFQKKTNSVYDKKKADEWMKKMEEMIKLYGPISSNTQNQQDAMKAMELIRAHQKGRGMAALNQNQIEYIGQKYL